MATQTMFHFRSCNGISCRDGNSNSISFSSNGMHWLGAKKCHSHLPMQIHHDIVKLDISKHILSPMELYALFHLSMPIKLQLQHLQGPSHVSFSRILDITIINHNHSFILK
jgi:hypothetical protein